MVNWTSTTSSPSVSTVDTMKKMVKTMIASRTTHTEAADLTIISRSDHIMDTRWEVPRGKFRLYALNVVDLNKIVKAEPLVVTSCNLRTLKGGDVHLIPAIMVWFPEDENSLPTPLEHSLAIEAINTLQQQMDQTSAKAAQLEQELQKTRANAEQIKREIFKRVVWLAPIRRLPADILSMLFIQACQDNWKAPLTLGAVCRRWRNVLIDTPRAWAFIQITPSYRLPHYKLLDLWLSRCGALKVDVSLGHRASPEVTDVIHRNERNLQCLSFFGNAKQLQGRYTQLEELRVGLYNPAYIFFNPYRIENEGSAYKEDVDVYEFPKLVSLHLHGPSPSVMEVIAHKFLLPSLRELHIHASGCHWLRIIQCCAGCLTMLTVERVLGAVDTVPKDEFDTPILLPRLQDLRFVRRDIVSRWPLLQTPCLQSYHEYDGQGISPIHSDVSSVTSLLLHQPEEVAWSNFPTLTHLQIRATEDVILREMTILTSNTTLCPSISSVKCVTVGSYITHEPLIALYMAARIGRTGTFIDFHYKNVEHDPREDIPSCFTFCPSHSRSDQPFWDPYDEGAKEMDEEEESDGYDEYEGEVYDDFESYDDWGNSSDAQEYFERLRYS